MLLADLISKGGPDTKVVLIARWMRSASEARRQSVKFPRFCCDVEAGQAGAGRFLLPKLPKLTTHFCLYIYICIDVFIYIYIYIYTFIFLLLFLQFIYYVFILFSSRIIHGFS